MNRQRLSMIGALAVEAMLYEVSATPKPGLVDRSNSGAHHDMDFFTFMSSAAALRGYFDECAAIGAGHSQQAVSGLLPYLQAAGIVAERQMFAMTQGVNTHKGMVFSLGILTGAAGWAAARGEALTADHLGDLAGCICDGLCEAAYGGLAKRPQDRLTKGEAMYLKYGVTGVRGEAQSGFRTVRELSLPVYRQARQSGTSVNDALVDALLHLLAGAADTNILGRHDRQVLCYAQQRAGEVVALGGMGTAAGRAAVLALDEDFIRRWISPGGSADLVAVTHFFYALESLWQKNREEDRYRHQQAEQASPVGAKIE